jgi:hypothetical protein
MREPGLPGNRELPVCTFKTVIPPKQPVRDLLKHIPVQIATREVRRIAPPWACK